MFNSRDISLLRADVAANCRRMIEIAKADGWPILVAGTVRDEAYQLQCYQNGTSKSKVPTFHGVKAGLAFDICKNVKGQEYSDAAFWAYCGALGKRMGFTWGGDWTSFVDKPHFQWDGGGKFTGSDILAGRYPPDMPLYGKEETAVTVEEAKKIVQQKAGLSSETMDFLYAYRWGDSLLVKLAQAMK